MRKLNGFLLLSAFLSGCAGQAPYDYTAYHRSNPSSILIMPPVNHTVDIKAPYGVMSQLSMPLAEAGYYVFPVSVVDETFKRNGVTTPDDAAGIPYQKLRQIYGADAALYTSVERYGTSYMVVASNTTVALNARLVDLRNGVTIWEGSSNFINENNGLIGALLNQIISSASDASFPVAGAAANQLLDAHSDRGILLGPRAPNYGQQK
ncbi:DUF799 domain-containing protein [Swingsia samuiensis]|uniref:DUF799 domain-containing protein n=1 Tax=Swingsia samuiensis TaxID=1293412 RepID=A0A4Y6ULP4_9PROT|nr:GNA1162 family protein [Swingsia samuiensis]QDH17700.1 hypothetical protein E3D00_09075 [Swingsia samuiensis]